jgi:AcrR family transcriptional regulator
MSKKDEIIEAAVKEFGEHSYDSASINRIIKASGTSKGTFYHYFRDKKTLYFAILEDSIRIKQEYFEKMMGEVRQEDSDFFSMMKSQAKAAAQFMRDNPELYRFGLKFAVEGGPIRNEFDERYLPAIGDSFMKIVEAGVAGRKFTKRYPPGFIARIIWHMSINYFDILFDKGASPTSEELENGLDMMYDFLKRGFS